MKNPVGKIHHDEQGFLLVVTMLILVVLTIIGMAALDSSTFEVRIAANDRWSKVAFNLADGTVYSTSKLISQAITDGSDPNHAPIKYIGFNTYEDDTAVPHAVNDFYKRSMGYTPTMTEAKAADATQPDPVPDFQIKPKGDLATETVEGYLIGRNAKMVAGGGAEFGAGAAGAGVGSGGGGAAVVFDVDLDGFAGNNSRASISARFRKVLGTSGGL